jgi:hypothetical protein
MEPAVVKLAGDGLAVGQSDARPAGMLFSGGYDAQRNTLFPAGVMGRPRGANSAAPNCRLGVFALKSPRQPQSRASSPIASLCYAPQKNLRSGSKNSLEREVYMGIL